MSKKTRDQLKSKFKNGDTPTEGDFADVFDSYQHLDDDEKSNVEYATDDEAKNANIIDKAVNPKGLKVGFDEHIKPTTEEVAGKEPKFNKNTAFNKDFGAGSGTVAEGNHVHKVGDLDGVMGASNRVDINREDYLATSQAVYRVNEKIKGIDEKVEKNKILKVGELHIGDVGSGSQRNDESYVIVHNAGRADYIVVGTLVTDNNAFQNGVVGNNDNDVSWVIAYKQDNSFYLSIREYQSESKNLKFEDALIKTD